MTAIPPNRLRIEAGLGYSLLNWQWCAMLAILGFPATSIVSIEVQVQRDRPVPPRTLEPAETGPTKPVTPPTPAAAPNPHRDDDKDRTCEICGRIGVRRFIPVAKVEDNRWRCSPSATRCPGNRPGFKLDVVEIDEPYPATSDIPAKPFPADVTPEPKLPDAYCQDCTRTWVIGPKLTRRMLDAAVEMHELKRGHVCHGDWGRG